MDPPMLGLARVRSMRTLRESRVVPARRIASDSNEHSSIPPSPTAWLPGMSSGRAINQTPTSTQTTTKIVCTIGLRLASAAPRMVGTCMRLTRMTCDLESERPVDPGKRVPLGHSLPANDTMDGKGSPVPFGPHINKYQSNLIFGPSSAALPAVDLQFAAQDQ